MVKKVLIAGLLGGVVLMVFTFVVNGIFRFRVNIDMKRVAEEQQVYEILKEQVTEPGRYVINPKITPERRFPENEPVFSVFYGGVGHEAAGKEMLWGFVVFLLAPTIGAWLLSQTSERVQNSYSRKVLFFVAIGLLFAVFADLQNFGIAHYPLKDALVLAGHSILVWTLVGLVVAWRMKPEKEQRPPTA